jgi:two-component system, OmpR family, sensor histidine kinase KdpD
VLTSPRSMPEATPAPRENRAPAPARWARGARWAGEIAAAVGAVTVSTGVAWILFGHQSLPDVAMAFLLGVVAVAVRRSLGAALLAAVLSVLSYDFFFIPPYLSFTVDDGRHVVTFVVMFVVAALISTLTQRIRRQASDAEVREQRTARLYAMTRELSSARGFDALRAIAIRHVGELCEGEAAILVPGPPGGADARGIDVPLAGAGGRIGVLRVVPGVRGRFDDLEQRATLETFAAQIAGALERARAADEAEEARLEAETERLRSALLSSVSHDLRTPLAVITGAATTLLTGAGAVDAAAQRDLLSAICDESSRLTRLVTNLLDMTRLTAGSLAVHKEWESIEAVAGAALGRVEERLAGRPIHASLPPDLPLVPFDAVLVEQVLINLLENAAKYTPAGSAIDIRAAATPDEVSVEVADRGPGVPAAERERIFDKFYRVPGARTGGAGLGLAICRGIVEAHGGRIRVADREGGGAVFCFTLPIEGAPPAVEEDGAPT